MNYINGSLKNYCDSLSARIPAPGGGSSAALCAAMAASLIAMVCRFTIGKEKYKKYETRLEAILSEALKIQKRSLALVNLDIQAYASGNKEKSLQVPLEICLLSHDLVRLSLEVLKKGNGRLASDAVLAAGLAEVAFAGASLYVEVNAATLAEKAKKYSKQISRVKILKIKVRRLRKNAEVCFG